MQNTISLIIAIYNRKDELFELLSSLALQNDKEFEIIVVDDGSLMALLPTIELFEEQLNIQYFRKTNSGPDCPVILVLKKQRMSGWFL